MLHLLATKDYRIFAAVDVFDVANEYSFHDRVTRPVLRLNRASFATNAKSDFASDDVHYYYYYVTEVSETRRDDAVANSFQFLFLKDSAKD